MTAIRFHNTKSSYPLPNDEAEVERLRGLHFVCRTLLGGNILAPLTAPKDILDVGTGPGSWCIEVAEQFPDAHIRGLDLSAIQPADAPKNCEFIIADLNDGLPFPDASMDFVHSR